MEPETGFWEKGETSTNQNTKTAPRSNTKIVFEFQAAYKWPGNPSQKKMYLEKKHLEV